MAAVAELAEVLAPMGTSPGAVSMLVRALAAAPASARLSYAGAMLGRPSEPSGRLRLVFADMPLDGSCTSMLRDLGPQQWTDVADLVARLAEASPSAVLHIDAQPDGRTGDRGASSSRRRR